MGGYGMRMESLTLRIGGTEIKRALRSMKLHQGLRIIDVRLEPGVVQLELALPGNIPFRPMIYLSNPSVQGAVVSLRISGPLGFGLPDIALSLIMPTLPSGVDYLGCGLILVDLIQVCQGAFRSIDLNGVSIEPDHISLDVACAEFDLESLPRAASLLQAISIEEL